MPKGNHLITDEMRFIFNEVGHLENEGGQIGETYLFHRWPKMLTHFSRAKIEEINTKIDAELSKRAQSYFNCKQWRS